MLSKLKAFLQNTHGGYAPLFAVLCVPLFGTAATAVEYSRVINARAHLQHALDAAALATAKELSVTMDSDYLAQYSRDFFDSNLHPRLQGEPIRFSFAFVQPEQGATTVTLSAELDHDTHMAGVIGIEELELHVSATVAAGNRTVEVALVMDNSGSMDSRTGGTSDTRIQRARSAATSLITSLHSVAALSNKPDPVRIGVVPFAGSVNIGPQYRGADWLDMYGWSSVHHNNIDWTGADTRGDGWPDAVATGEGWKSSSTLTLSTGPNPPSLLPPGISTYSTNWLSRWTLLDAISTDWAGCVEMRPGDYSMNDTPPGSLDADTLFVPMFAPDEPDYIHSNEDDDYRNNYLNDYRRVGSDYSVRRRNSRSNTKQHMRQDWSTKYNADAAWSSSEASSYYHRDRLGNRRSRDFGDWGPNQGCTTDPLLPLTSSAQTSINAVNAMAAGGYTNVQAGLMWGWRTLSAALPFSEGRPYTTYENDKYIILLTDGNNTFPGQSTMNETEYYAWDFGKHDRVLETLPTWQSNVTAMNTKTANACANIKAITDADNEAAIRIFTIAYDVPNGSSVKSLLYDCASTGRDGRKYYYDVQGSAIADAMAAIGNEISELRISK